LTIEKLKKLESIGFTFKGPLQGPIWDERFQELVDSKKISGHVNVSTTAGALGRWVSKQHRKVKNTHN
jgi:hypothetical protein